MVHKLTFLIVVAVALACVAPVGRVAAQPLPFPEWFQDVRMKNLSVHVVFMTHLDVGYTEPTRLV